MKPKRTTAFLLIIATTQTAFCWGFHAHKLINRHAVYLLPNNSLFNFFKTNIDYLTENAVNADKRRYTQEAEACRHYIDLDSYAQVGQTQLPKYYSEAKIQLAEDSLKAHGILPWHIFHVQKNLTKAMLEKDADLILRLAADLGHYVGDANVPLHTTHNYDGQLTNQKGIHALWETRIPELYTNNYDFLIGKAEFVTDVQALAWETVRTSNAAVDSVLSIEARLTKEFDTDEKYGFEERNFTTTRVYSKQFAERYSELLNGQVERQMRTAIKMVADLWYTSWIEAGQPDLSLLNLKKTTEDPEKEPDKNIKQERLLESHRICNHDHTFENPHILTTQNK